MIKRVEGLNHLKSIHKEDKRIIKNVYECNTNPLFFVRKDGDKIVTNKWFVNHLGELIYDIRKNRWVNMKMYENNESTVTNDIYYFE